MIAKGNQTTEGGSRKLYVGIGAVKVLGVNPSKKELEDLYGRELEQEPEYVNTVERDGKQVPSVRISFVVTTDPEKNNGIELTTNHVFFLVKNTLKSQEGKAKVIDKYGRTAWVTAEEYKAKAIPMSKAGSPIQVDSDYRLCYEGEEELTLFLKNLLNIPSVMVYTNGVWTPNPRVTPTDCEVRLDTIDKILAGDVAELREAISYQPNNVVKVPFGVRNDADRNRQLQTTYTRLCFKNAVTDYSKFEAEITSRKEAGGLSNVEFDAAPLHEYVVDPTTLQPTMEQAAAANIAGEDTPW